MRTRVRKETDGVTVTIMPKLSPLLWESSMSAPLGAIAGRRTPLWPLPALAQGRFFPAQNSRRNYLLGASLDKAVDCVIRHFRRFNIRM